MKVGVSPVLDSHGGGIYQYSLMVLDALDQLRGRLEPVIVDDKPARKELRPWASSGWRIIGFRPYTPRTVARRILVQAVGESATIRAATLARKLTGRARGALFSPSPNQTGRTALQRASRQWARLHGIELMLYPAPMTRSFESGVPYVMAIHDLQHRIHPEFPEVSADGEWEAREYLFANGVRNAEAILVDSEVGREDVLQFYGHLTSPERVRVLSFVLPPYLVRPTDAQATATLRSFGVDGRYLLFPAQFWPHKNHVRVTEAVAALHRQGVEVTVVMTGTASGPHRARVLADVREIVGREGIDHLIRILGYVDDDAMGSLYAGSSGVILPTLFGPTNIPVVEGWAMGVPVLSSDIRGIREQCGDAALLVDPLSAEAIAEGIRRLWTDEALRERLVSAGKDRRQRSDVGTFRDELGRILMDVESSLRTRGLLGTPT